MPHSCNEDLKICSMWNNIGRGVGKRSPLGGKWQGNPLVYSVSYWTVFLLESLQDISHQLPLIIGAGEHHLCSQSLLGKLPGEAALGKSTQCFLQR